MENLREKVAKYAQDLCDNKITYEQFIDAVPEETDDEDISELISLIEHEPAKGGFGGVSEKEHANYIKNLFTLIDKLKTNNKNNSGDA